MQVTEKGSTYVFVQKENEQINVGSDKSVANHLNGYLPSLKL